MNRRAFEKERATYVNDPFNMKQHKQKYIDFINNKLKLNDEQLCIKGQSLLKKNSVISGFFSSLVIINKEIKEKIFWKRFFYWQYQYQLREERIHRHSKNNGKNENEIEIKEENIISSNSNEIDSKMDENVTVLEDIELGSNIIQNLNISSHSSSSSDANVSQMNHDLNENESTTESDNTQISSATQVSNNATIEESVERFSETSWTELQPGASVVSSVAVKEVVNEELNVGNNENVEKNEMKNDVKVNDSSIVDGGVDDNDDESSDVDWDTWD